MASCRAEVTAAAEAAGESVRRSRLIVIMGILQSEAGERDRADDATSAEPIRAAPRAHAPLGATEV